MEVVLDAATVDHAAQGVLVAQGLEPVARGGGATEEDADLAAAAAGRGAVDVLHEAHFLAVLEQELGVVRPAGVQVRVDVAAEHGAEVGLFGAGGVV